MAIGSGENIIMTIDPKHVEHWRDRQRQQQRQHQQLAQQARQDLVPIVEILAYQFGVQRVILFGSLARGRFVVESDIDLAVEGIAPDVYFSALAAVNRLVDRWVDLKRWEDLDPHFQQRVLATGEVLYERDRSQ
jgi:uncharacterized protein